jgi:hypothetical protein
VQCFPIVLTSLPHFLVNEVMRSEGDAACHVSTEVVLSGKLGENEVQGWVDAPFVSAARTGDGRQNVWIASQARNDDGRVAQGGASCCLWIASQARNDDGRVV